MQSIQNVSLEWAILHTADSALDSPQLADEQLAVDEDLRVYFEDHIKSCLRSTQTQMGKFLDANSAAAAACSRMIEEGPGCYLGVSHAIAWWLHRQVGRQNSMTADVAICVFSDLDNEDRFVAILKLDPMRMYLRNSEEQAALGQILVMPDAKHGLRTWAIVRTFDEEARYDLLHNHSKEDDFWTVEFLECEEIATPRQMTKIVLSETGKWLDANSDMVSPEVAADLSRAVRETAQSNLMDLEELSERVIPNSEMRDDYIGRMLDKGLTETTFEPDREFAKRQASKTTYVLDDGVTLAGPTEVIDDVVQILPKSDDGKTRIVIESKKFFQK
jgi:hypothetical protein